MLFPKGSVRASSGELEDEALEVFGAVGDGFRLIAGCDKTFETCKAKYANAANFRGFPHMPGEDWVTAYPKQGAAHKGEVRRWQEVRHDL